MRALRCLVLLMAIAFDAGVAALNAGASSLTYAHTCTSATFLRVTACWFESGTTPTIVPSGVTYNGVAMTVIPSSRKHIAVGDGANSIGIEQWGLVSPAAGANNVVVTMSAAPTNLFSGADSWTGVDTTTPYGTAAVSNSTSTTPSVVIGSDSGEVAIGSIFIVTLTDLSTSDTQRWESAVSAFLQAGGASDAGANPNVTINWAGAIGPTYNAVASGVSLKPASGGATTAPWARRFSRLGAAMMS